MTSPNEDEEIKMTFKPLFEHIPKLLSLIQDCLANELKNVHGPMRILGEREELHDIINLIQGKWTLDILYLILIKKSLHFNELKSMLEGISSRLLTDRLKKLDEYGLLKREIHDDLRPIGVSYSLNLHGKNFVSLFIPAFLYYLTNIQEVQENPDSSQIT